MAWTDLSELPNWTLALAPLAGCQEQVRAKAPSMHGIRGLVMRFLAWRARIATVRALNSLDQATLRDLGIRPSEIEALVHGGNEGRKRGYDRDWWRKR